MSDVNFITQAGKSALNLPSQAHPAIAEELRPVPQAELDQAVPPPAKGGEPGLGEHLDVYDTEAGSGTKSESTAESEQPNGAALAAAAQKSVPKPELLGDKTGLPQPTTDPIHLELPFLKPLGADYLGHTIDSRV
jgi:hypothetical protein